jgi:hypothetical protein
MTTMRKSVVVDANLARVAKDRNGVTATKSIVTNLEA